MGYLSTGDIFNRVYDSTTSSIKVTGSSSNIGIIGDTYSSSENATVGAAPVVILSSVDMLAYNAKCITIKNTGINTIESIVIQVSPNDTDWEDYDSSTFANLLSSEIISLQISADSHRYWRVTGASSAGSTSSVWVNANTLLKGNASDITGQFVVNGTLTGSINGINVTYTTEYAFITGTTQLYKNGVRQDKDAYYTEFDSMTIILNTAPLVGDVLFIDYMKNL